MLQDIYFSFSKLDYVYYMFVCIIIFSLLNHTNIFNSTNFIPLIVTAYFVYFLLNNKISNDYSKMEYQNNKLRNIQIDKYPYIKEDIHIIDCIDKLQSLSKINRLKFNTILSCLNKFFKYYKMSKQYNLRPADIYNSAKDNSKRALNALKSFVIENNKYPYFTEDRVISEDKFLSENNNITKCRNTLKNRLGLYLNEMERKINNEWDKGNINIYSSPIYANDEEGYELTTGISKLYDIY
jgi:hypothetical protein